MNIYEVGEHTYVPPGAFFMYGEKGHWTHGGLILDNDELIESHPDGAKIKPVETIYGNPAIVVSDIPVQHWLDTRPIPSFLGAREMLEFSKRYEIAAKARTLKDVGYSMLDELVQEFMRTLAKRSIKLRPYVIESFLADHRHLTFAALIDRVYLWSDIHLFDDNRVLGNVLPADLDRYIVKLEVEVARGA